MNRKERPNREAGEKTLFVAVIKRKCYNDNIGLKFIHSMAATRTRAAHNGDGNDSVTQ